MHWTIRKFSGNQRIKAVKRYFRNRSALRKWIFSDIEIRKEKEKRIVSIVKMMDTKIQRHVKVRSNINPFDSSAREYYQNRALWKSEVRLRQRKHNQAIYAKMQRNLQLGI